MRITCHHVALQRWEQAGFVTSHSCRRKQKEAAHGASDVYNVDAPQTHNLGHAAWMRTRGAQQVAGVDGVEERVGGEATALDGQPVQLPLLVGLGQDVLLDGRLAHQPVDVHRPGLPNAVAPVLRLRGTAAMAAPSARAQADTLPGRRFMMEDVGRLFLPHMVEQIQPAKEAQSCPSGRNRMDRLRASLQTVGVQKRNILNRCHGQDYVWLPLRCAVPTWASWAGFP